MDTKVYNKEGKEVGSIKLPESVFGLSWNGDLVHQVMTSTRTSMRKRTAHTKDRSDVAGGGKKPWKQKGTGRARHGSIRSPIWVGGGVAHGPTNETNYSRKVNKKSRIKAIYTVLSRKAKDGEIVLVESTGINAPKTKEAKSVLHSLSKIKGFSGISGKKTNAAVLLTPDRNLPVEKSFRNFSNINTVSAQGLTINDVLDYKFLIITEPKKVIPYLESKAILKKSSIGAKK
jgi:large subunit ribosomal protein L4